MTFGTTFAFFSSTVKKNDALEVGSANYKLSLDSRVLYNEKTIIPTNDNDIMLALNNRCIDDLGFGACYAYTITMKSEGEDQEVLGKFQLLAEELPNLKYMILDADNMDDDGNYSIYKDIAFANSEYETIGEPIKLENGNVRSFILLIWLSNLDNSQNKEAGKSFKGNITINSTLGSKITGTINARL